MLRVSLTGPESTGKTSLSRALAAHYCTSWAPEYAREYLETRGPNYTLTDLEAIAQGQLRAETQAEIKAVEQGRPVFFCDTDLLVIKIWAEHAFGRCPDWILRRMAQQHYDLVLLLNVDLPWEPDPLREHPDLRQYFYQLYRQNLQQQAARFVEISGSPAERFKQAHYYVDKLLAGLPFVP